MSGIPAFEIGVWNGWILMLYIPLHPLIMILIDKLVGTKEIFKKMETPTFNKIESIMNIFSNFVLLLGLLIYSILLPLQLETAWFYVGCVL